MRDVRLLLRRHASQLWLVGAVVLGGMALADVLKSVAYATQIRRGTFRALPTDARASGPLLLPTRIGGDTASLDLRERTALVFFYSSKCLTCGRNMPRWVDLVFDLKEKGLAVPIYAVQADDSVGSDYWRSLLPLVTKVTPRDHQLLQRLLHVRGTPSTIVVKNGTVVASYVGGVGDWRREHIVNLLSQ